MGEFEYPDIKMVERHISALSTQVPVSRILNLKNHSHHDHISCHYSSFYNETDPVSIVPAACRGLTINLEYHPNRMNPHNEPPNPYLALMGQPNLIIPRVIDKSILILMRGAVSTRNTACMALQSDALVVSLVPRRSHKSRSSHAQ